MAPKEPEQAMPQNRPVDAVPDAQLPNRPVILMTRPAAQGSETARVLAQETGLRVIETPLLAIRSIGALPDMTRYRTLIFTSRNGVQSYAALGGPAMPAICVGRATAQAARDCGHDAHTAGGDAAAVIDHVVSHPPQGPILHIRGEVAQGDIAATLTAAGHPTDDCVLYAQDLLDLTPDAMDALTSGADVVVPLYSPRTARHFADLCPPGSRVHLVSISANTDLATRAINATSRGISDAPDAPAMQRAVRATVERLEGR